MGGEEEFGTLEAKQFPSILSRHHASLALEEHQVKQRTAFRAALEENGCAQHKHDLADETAVCGLCSPPDLPTHDLNSGHHASRS